MSVAKTIELTSTSREGFEAAIRDAIAKASETGSQYEGRGSRSRGCSLAMGRSPAFAYILRSHSSWTEPRPNGVAQAGGSGPTPAAPGQGRPALYNTENPRISRGFREVPHTGFEPVLPP